MGSRGRPRCRSPIPCTVTVGAAGVAGKGHRVDGGGGGHALSGTDVAAATGGAGHALLVGGRADLSGPSVVVLGMTPSAGLSESGSMVWVGPAFCLRAPRVPSSVAESLMLPAAVNPQEPSSSML